MLSEKNRRKCVDMKRQRHLKGSLALRFRTSKQKTYADFQHIILHIVLSTFPTPMAWKIIMKGKAFYRGTS